MNMMRWIRDRLYWRRLQLTDVRRGVVYLDRWGFGFRNGPTVLLHKLGGPDPDRDLHDHPWTFWSIVLRGGYTETVVEQYPVPGRPGSAVSLSSHFSRREVVRTHRAGSVHKTPHGAFHAITSVYSRPPTWTLVICGPKRSSWGFLVDGRWMKWTDYETWQAERGGRSIEATKTTQPEELPEARHG